MFDEAPDEAVRSVLARFLPGACPALEVGPGWYPIILDLDQDLGAIDPDYQLVQVKEKFGRLRYYVEPEPGKPRRGFAKLIRSAERMAERTCEECGGAGAAARRGSWVRTLCAEDAAGCGFVPEAGAAT